MMKWGVRKHGTLTFWTADGEWSDDVDIARLFDRVGDAQRDIGRAKCEGKIGGRVEIVPFALRYTPVVLTGHAW